MGQRVLEARIIPSKIFISECDSLLDSILVMRNNYIRAIEKQLLGLSTMGIDQEFKSVSKLAEIIGKMDKKIGGLLGHLAISRRDDLSFTLS